MLGDAARPRESHASESRDMRAVRRAVHERRAPGGTIESPKTVKHP